MITVYINIIFMYVAFIIVIGWRNLSNHRHPWRFTRGEKMIDGTDVSYNDSDDE
jgi:hypothetical protein